MRLGPAQVHAEQHLGPVLRLGSARARLDVEVGIIAVHLACKHAPELELRQLGLEPGEVVGDLVHGTTVVFVYRQFEETFGIVQTGRELFESADDCLEFRPLLSQSLRAIRVIPDVGLLEFALNFRQAFLLAVIVKDTPLTQQCVPGGRRSTG
jgi:hypothetical protein